jgi:hypothetical protein
MKLAVNKCALFKKNDLKQFIINVSNDKRNTRLQEILNKQTKYKTIKLHIT